MAAHAGDRARSLARADEQLEFWLMMQVAMLYWFAMTYPVSRWLLRSGVKEKM